MSESARTSSSEDQQAPAEATTDIGTFHDGPCCNCVASHYIARVEELLGYNRQLGTISTDLLEQNQWLRGFNSALKSFMGDLLEVNGRQRSKIETQERILQEQSDLIVDLTRYLNTAGTDTSIASAQDPNYDTGIEHISAHLQLLAREDEAESFQGSRE
ncbi:hypothetical protein NMY22_g17714 [Coprinellus aureogranulatus]|nr:hypothetical protein NMY22_g17714 [Coprinellus aureogranulatus]